MSDLEVESGEDLSPTQLLDSAILADPYEFYDRLRREAPVWVLPESGIVVVTSFAGISDAVGRPEDFSSNIRALLYRDEHGNPATRPFGAGESNVLATADPPVHTAHRGAVFPELVNRRMRELRPEVDELAMTHIGPALERDRVDFMSEIANAIPIRVVSRLIGWEGENAEELLTAAFDSTEILSANRSLEQIDQAMERTAAVGAWIAEQLTAALENPPDHGLLGVIANAVNAGELDMVAAIVIMHTLLSAGGESTTSLLGNAVDILARDQELQQRLRDEPELQIPFIEEVLRLESPFRNHMRHTYHDTELLGTAVPADSTVLLMWGAANRDPDEYDRPNEVVLDRRGARHHVGFGRGIHLCVGAPLARLEAAVILSRFLEGTLRFSPDPEAVATREDSLMIRRFNSLPLVVESAGRRPLDATLDQES